MTRLSLAIKIVVLRIDKRFCTKISVTVGTLSIAAIAIDKASNGLPRRGKSSQVNRRLSSYRV